MSIKCGHCKNHHGSVAEVKACSAPKIPVTAIATGQVLARVTPALYADSQIPGMHPRQAAILIQVPEHARTAVRSRAHLLMNLGGGIYSQCLAAAKRDLDRLGGDLDALEELSRRDNHSAMASCGCSACSRDVEAAHRSTQNSALNDLVAALTN